MINRIWFSTLVVTCFLVVSSSFSFGDDWPQFLGPHRNGISSETALIHSFPKSGLTILWSVGVGEGFGGAAIRDGEVYLLDRIVGKQDVMRCFDLATGKELWRFANDVPGRLPYPGSRGVPTVEEHVVYGISGFGHVYCIDRKTHKLIWGTDIKKEYDADPPHFGFAQSPLVYEETVIIAPMSQKVGLVALDKRTGKEVWRTGSVGHGFSTPTLHDVNGVHQLIFQTILDRSSKQGLVTSFDPSTGKKLWEYRDYYVMCPIPGAVTISENKLFLTGGYEAGSIMLSTKSTRTGRGVSKLFHIEKGSQIHQPILYREHLYLIVNENANQKVKQRMNEGGLMCMDLSGNIKWRTGKSPNFGRGGIILADNMLIIQDGHSGILRLVEPNPEQYVELGQANIFGITDTKDHQMWAPMALADGKLVMRSQTEMKCIDLRVNP